MTLRELFIALGYQIDETSEKKAEQGIKSLKDKASQILGAIGIGFSLVAMLVVCAVTRKNGAVCLDD